MIQVNVNLHGLDDTSERVQDAAAIGLLRAAEHIKAAAQENAPVETGHLRDSIDVRPHDVHEAAVYAPGPYSRWQEFGPHFNPWVLKHEEGQSPYLSSAIEVEGEHAIEIIAAAIREEFG